MRRKFQIKNILEEVDVEVISVVVVVAVLMLILLGAFLADRRDIQADRNRFETVENIGGHYKIVEDKATGVLYITYHGAQSFGISPLYNADGSIATRYSNERPYSEKHPFDR